MWVIIVIVLIVIIVAFVALGFVSGAGAGNTRYEDIINEKFKEDEN